MGDESRKLQRQLIKRINVGFSILSGLQQGACSEPGEEQMLQDAEDELKDICRDVLASFGYTDKGLKWQEIKE